MSTILQNIVEDTREVIAERKGTASLADLESRPLFERDPHSLRDALDTQELSIIAETKKASPSEGVIRTPYLPAQLAQAYRDNGAAAISVLTEPRHFQGSLEHLAWVRAHVELPLLRKDFIIDPYQVIEAKAHGADAVLLIAAILSPSQLLELLKTAHEIGLSTLVEVHNLKELDKLDFDFVRVLGANNRNLETFEIDLNQSIRVFREVPDFVTRVSESGLKTAKELAIMAEYKVDAVLMGTTLMKADDPGSTLASLISETEERLAQAPANK